MNRPIFKGEVLLLKKVWLGMLIALMLIPAVAMNARAEGISLKLRWQEGKTYRYRQEVTETTVQELPEMMMKGTYTTTSEYIYSYLVKGLEADGSALVAVNFESIRTVQAGPEETTQYDSNDIFGDISLLHLPLAILTSQPVVLKLGPTGTVNVVEGYEEAIKALLKLVDFSIYPKGTKKFLQKHCLDMIGDEALQEMFEDDYTPDGPVRVGDSWPTRQVFSKGFPYIAEIVFTLKASEKGIATLEKKAILEPNLKAPAPLVVDKLEMRYFFSGTEEGLMEILESDGNLWYSRTTQEMNGQIVATKGPKGFKGRSWPFHSSSVTVIQFLPEELSGIDGQEGQSI